MENDFLAMEKILTAKKSFSSFSEAKVYIFSLGQNFLSGTKMILFGEKDGVIVS